MSDGIYSALSGAIAQQRSLDVVANNVANASTVGFRGDRVAFDEALSRTQPGVRGIPRPGQPVAASQLRFVNVSRMTTEQTEGPLRQTGNPLDLALQGDGYFAIQTPQGERYTRAGSFVADASGIVKTTDGMPVLGEGRPATPLRIPAGAREITVGRDGTMSVDGNAIGRVRVVRFAQPNMVTKEGLTRFVARAGVRPVADDGTTEVTQGALESANVNAVAGMNELVTVSRLFETFQRVIQTYRDIDDRTAKDVGSRT